GELSQRVDRFELALVARQRQVVATGQARRPRALDLLDALPPPAGQPAAGERAPRDDPDAVALARRQHVGFDATYEDRVRRLLAHEALAAPAIGGPLRFDDLRRRERRRARVADLP